MKDKKRKQSREKQNEKRSLRAAILLIVTCVIVPISMITFNRYRAVKTSKPSATSQYSTAKMDEFWDTHLQKTVMDELFANKYSLPKIRERFKVATGRIQELYHMTNIGLTLCYSYSLAGTSVRAGTTFVGGKPKFDIIIPKLIDDYEAAQRHNEPDVNAMIQYVVVADIMHELDHMAFGSVYSDGQSLPLEQLVDEERRIWALTCENTLRPMIEDYHVTLDINGRTLYVEWLKAGRNADSPSWRRFIERNYRQTR